MSAEKSAVYVAAATGKVKMLLLLRMLLLLVMMEMLRSLLGMMLYVLLHFDVAAAGPLKAGTRGIYPW